MSPNPDPHDVSMSPRKPRAPKGGAGDSGAYLMPPTVKHPNAFPIDSFDLFDEVPNQASTFITGMLDEWMRQQRVREEAVAEAAAKMNCGYAVIEERRVAVGDLSMESVLVYHYVLSPWILRGQRLAFPSWESWEAWQGRGRPL